jgi:hypothetical protein
MKIEVKTMKIGVPQGLLYPRYRAFITAFLEDVAPR